jgi:hypothetical protein
LLLGLAGVQFVGGGLWDASQHFLTGEVPGGSDFLWPRGPGRFPQREEDFCMTA